SSTATEVAISATAPMSKLSVLTRVSRLSLTANGAAFAFLEVDRDLVDRTRKLKRQLVGEIYRRTDIHAYVETFTYRNLLRNGFWQLTFGNFGAVRGHSHGSTLAKFAGLTAVSEIDFELHLALRERSCCCDGVPLQRKVVVDEHRLVIAHVQAVTAFQPAVRDNHAFDAAFRHL